MNFLWGGFAENFLREQAEYVKKDEISIKPCRNLDHDVVGTAFLSLGSFTFASRA